MRYLHSKSHYNLVVAYTLVNANRRQLVSGRHDNPWVPPITLPWLRRSSCDSWSLPGSQLIVPVEALLSVNSIREDSAVPLGLYSTLIKSALFFAHFLFSFFLLPKRKVLLWTIRCRSTNNNRWDRALFKSKPENLFVKQSKIRKWSFSMSTFR